MRWPDNQADAGTPAEPTRRPVRGSEHGTDTSAGARPETGAATLVGRRDARHGAVSSQAQRQPERASPALSVSCVELSRARLDIHLSAQNATTARKTRLPVRNLIDALTHGYTHRSARGYVSDDSSRAAASAAAADASSLLLARSDVRRGDLALVAVSGVEDLGLWDWDWDWDWPRTGVSAAFGDVG
ncbi:hypothetical protein JHW43_001432 [Diplocarpon mali]|nr:hypothetical protein JHW43_001432 [Diplocarpon mali]